MTSYLYEYGWILIVLIGVAGYFAYVYKKKGKEAMLKEMRERAYQLMIMAEKRYDTGEEKFKWVARTLYIALPGTTKKIFNQEDIEYFIQEVYENVGDFLDDGKLNDSFI